MPTLYVSSLVILINKYSLQTLIQPLSSPPQLFNFPNKYVTTALVIPIDGDYDIPPHIAGGLGHKEQGHCDVGNNDVKKYLS